MGEKVKELDKLQKNAELEFLEKNQVNFSKQAKAIVKKIRAGHRPTSTDYFILLNTNQDQIDEKIKFEEINDRMNKGRMTRDDVDYLVGKLGSLSEHERDVKQYLYEAMDQANLSYALEHRTEFTSKEIKELEKKCIECSEFKNIESEIIELLSC